MANKRLKIPEAIQKMLWGKAAGRCEFSGCNKPLWRTSTTKESVNIADVAHVIAFSERGPRGNAKLSKELAKDLSNLMLLCDECHTTVDSNNEDYQIDLLREMKESHEHRIEIVTGIGSDKQSEILLYGANVGHHSSPLSYQKAVRSMLPEWYPASINPISLGMVNSSFRDHDQNFWQIEDGHLRRHFAELVSPRLAERGIQHLSVFAFAPQPLLTLLGFLLSDIPAAEVYQLHREPPDWRWQDHPNGFEYQTNEPTGSTGQPALVLSLSATVMKDRITAVLRDNFSMWTVTVSEPNNDFLKSRTQLRQFRETIRPLLDRIKAQHGESAMIHVFPAVPVAVAVELGRIIMPKADLPMRIYDQNRGLGGFIYALDINTNPIYQGVNK